MILKQSVRIVYLKWFVFLASHYVAGHLVNVVVNESISSRFPVVSGFYKLLEICMKICNRISFFKVLLMTIVQLKYFLKH